MLLKMLISRRNRIYNHSVAIEIGHSIALGMGVKVALRVRAKMLNPLSKSPEYTCRTKA